MSNEIPLSEYKLPLVVSELTEEHKSVGKSASVILALFATINTVIIQIMKNEVDSTSWRVLRTFAYIGLLLNASGAVSAILVIHNAYTIQSFVRHDIFHDRRKQDFSTTHHVARKAFKTGQLDDEWMDLEKQSELASYFGIGSTQAFQYLFVFLTMGLGFLCLLITVTLWVWCNEPMSVAITVTLFVFIATFPLLYVVFRPFRSLIRFLSHQSTRQE
ncbi:hypothetical protein FRB91_009355 [Serendipita sp. 411]|nr:hypothetical protein FRC18_011927 [Serendipita sp. 400]KAG8850091.1 hypothetical protein FRB91_009355 [Serendipita sp. 411]